MSNQSKTSATEGSVSRGDQNLTPTEYEELVSGYEKYCAPNVDFFNTPEPLCRHCKMPEMSCECRQYDLEGNER